MQEIERYVANLPHCIHSAKIHSMIFRYPIIERAVADVRIFNDATFISNLESSIRKTLSDGQGGGKASTTGAF